MVLDLQQRAAVHSTHRNTLVLAGAGSGKTRVLVERIDYLINKRRVSPFEIMALTFTRRAAQEMRSRLEASIGSTAHRLKIGTMHSLALRFIRMYGDEIGIRPSHLTIYGPWEESFILKETAKLVKAKGKYQETIENFYSTLVEPAEDHPHRRLFEVFMARLKANNSITYGLLLTHMKRLMPSITSRTISHVLVDEAQDIDSLQWSIILDFQGLNPACKLFVVGDQDQSIYEWRGAKPDYMSAIAKNFHLFRLENNYRSVFQIVCPANRLISKNERRIPKTMYAVREDPGKLVVSKDQDSKAVAAMLAAKDNGFQVAVLSRTHKLLESLSRALDEMKVEHHHCGRTAKVMDTESFRRVHALFKLRHNPFDNFSFSLAREFLGCGDDEYLKIMENSLAFSESNFQTWAKTTRQPAFLRWASSEPWSFNALIQFAREITMDPDSSICLKVAQTCADKGMTLVEYLDWVATWDIQDDVKDGSQAKLQLMTIHAAKGLEFETVVVIGVNEGILPSKQAAARDPNVEEERRLAYVAMTRAERELILAVRPVESTYQYEGAAKPRVYYNPVSRFLGEMG